MDLSDLIAEIHRYCSIHGIKSKNTISELTTHITDQMSEKEKQLWVTYLGGGYGDEDDHFIEIGIGYKVFEETDTCYIVENMLDEKIAVYKYKCEILDDME